MTYISALTSFKVGNTVLPAATNSIWSILSDVTFRNAPLLTVKSLFPYGTNQCQKT